MFLLLFLVLLAYGLSQDYHCCRYLDCKKLLDFANKNVLEMGRGRVKVRIYDKLIYNVCPNPFIERLVNEINGQYRMGIFVSYQIVVVPLGFIKDRKNCDNWICGE